MAETDLIIRQAAIDALRKCNRHCIDLFDSYHIDIEDAEARIRRLQPAQNETTDEQAIEHLQSTGWMQNHDREMYESGLREQLADDSGSYDSLIPCEDTISRQAAIDALWKAEKELLYYDSAQVAVNVIKDLPAAQSEPSSEYARGYNDAKREIALSGEYERAYQRGKADAQPEIIRCKECIYYDPPHIEDNGKRREYSEMPEDAFDVFGVGLVSADYGINIGGRCLRDYNVGYSEDKRVYIPKDNYCGRAKRRTDG